MRKYFLFLLTIIMIFLAGCDNGDNVVGDDSQNYTYVISHSGSATSSNIKTSSIEINSGPIFATNRQIVGLVAWKVFDDGKMADAEGIWTYDSPDNAYIEDTESVLHMNSIVITSPEPATGQISLYVPEDNITVTKNVFIYGVKKVTNKANEAYPNSIDFVDGVDETDIIFDGLTVKSSGGKNLYIIKDVHQLNNIVDIPSENFVQEYTFDAFDMDMIDSVIICKTQEGYYAKMKLGSSVYSPSLNKFEADLIYYVERESNTQFTY